MSGHAVAVLIISPEGIPLVRDPKKPAPVFWKLPGGKSNGGETALECGSREIEEEIGLRLEGGSMVVASFEDRGNHDFTLFRADLETLPLLKQQGNEGEEVAVFTPAEILGMVDFFPPHRKVVEKILRTL